jgi:hypothetical protein
MIANHSMRLGKKNSTNLGLEWTRSHQCTSCEWAHWGCFLDEWKSDPPCPHIYIYIYIFHLFSTPKFPPLLPTIYLPPPTYHLPPPSYLPPTNPSPPLTPSPELQRRRAGMSLEQGRGSSQSGTHVGPR